MGEMKLSKVWSLWKSGRLPWPTPTQPGTAATVPLHLSQKVGSVPDVRVTTPQLYCSAELVGMDGTPGDGKDKAAPGRSATGAAAPGGVYAAGRIWVSVPVE